MKVKIFGKAGCAKCDTTKNKLKHFLGKWEVEDKVELIFHDLDTIDGMAEGAFHDVSDALPTTIIEKNESVLARWEGEVPNSDIVKEHLTK